MEYPWNEQATLIRMAGKTANGSDEDAEILFEGKLKVIAGRVSVMTRSARARLRISLPDRQVRPHFFQDDSLLALVDALEKLPR